MSDDAKDAKKEESKVLEETNVAKTEVEKETKKDKEQA